MNIHSTEFQHPNATWTEEDVLALVSMYNDGRSAGEIAKAIGTTRNAVIGKTNRLKARGVVQKRVFVSTAKAPRIPIPSRAKVVCAPVVKLPKPRPKPKIAARAPGKDVYGPGIPIMDDAVMARRGRCKFGLWGVRDYPPLESKLVCGRPSLPGKSWCEHCYQIVYPPKIKRAA